MSNQNLVEIGCFVGVHGIKGNVKLKSYTETLDNIYDYKDFFLEKNENTLDIKFVGKVKGNLICKIEGVSTRNEAEIFRGLKLFVKRESLPILQDDEFYQRDLLTFKVYNSKKEFFGSITSFNDFGGGLLAEVMKEKKLYYLPINNNFLKEINYEEKEVTINLDLSFLDN